MKTYISLGDHNGRTCCPWSFMASGPTPTCLDCNDDSAAFLPQQLTGLGIEAHPGQPPSASLPEIVERNPEHHPVQIGELANAYRSFPDDAMPLMHKLVMEVAFCEALRLENEDMETLEQIQRDIEGKPTVFMDCVSDFVAGVSATVAAHYDAIEQLSSTITDMSVQESFHLDDMTQLNDFLHQMHSIDVTQFQPSDPPNRVMQELRNYI